MIETLIQLQLAIHHNRLVRISTYKLFYCFITTRYLFRKQMVSNFSTFKQLDLCFKLLNLILKSFNNDCWICCLIFLGNIFNQGNSSSKLTCGERFLNMLWVSMHSCYESSLTVASNRISQHHNHHGVSIRNMNLISMLIRFV